MRLLCIATLVLSTVGCVLPGDLDRLKIAQEDLDAGRITKAEYNGVVDVVVDDAAGRVEAGVTGIMELLETLGVSGLVTGLGAWGLNRYRNSNRKKRGEVV